MQGTLYLKPLQAELTHNTEGIFGKMDPYIIFTLGNQRIKTSICKNGGKKPYWNDVITFTKDISDHILSIEIWDDETVKRDKYIANAHLDLNDFISQGHVIPWVDLDFETKGAGKLLLDITYEQGNFDTHLQQPTGMSQTIGIQPQIPQSIMSTGLINQAGGQPFDYSKQPGLVEAGMSQGLGHQVLHGFTQAFNPAMNPLPLQQNMQQQSTLTQQFPYQGYPGQQF